MYNHPPKGKVAGECLLILKELQEPALIIIFCKYFENIKFYASIRRKGPPGQKAMFNPNPSNFASFTHIAVALVDPGTAGNLLGCDMVF